MSGQEELTLSGALEQALENNYGLIISRAATEMAEINNNWGTAGRYPTIGFDASDNNSYESEQQHLYQPVFGRSGTELGAF